MSRLICKQPNGLYCIFSTVVDCVIEYNMTEAEYIEECAEQAREQARERLERGLTPFEQMKNYFRPNNMSEQEFKEILVKMGEL